METLDTIWNWFGSVADLIVFGISVTRLAAACGVLLVTMLARRLLIGFLEGTARRWAGKTAFELDDRLIEVERRPMGLLIMVAGLYLALFVLGLPTEPMNVRGAMFSLLKVLLAVNVAWFAWQAVGILDEYLDKGFKKFDSDIALRLLPLVRKTLRITIIIVTMVFVLQNLGYSVSSLVAGLGIGGLAFAFAAKDTIANVFGSVTIFIDRPFVIGDWIVTKGVEGNVEDIGFRSTKIRTFAKTLVTIPNNVLANEVVENFQARPKQRVKTMIGLTYDTPPEKLKAAVDKAREIILAHPAVDKSYCQVWFAGLGDFSLNILLYFFIARPTWAEFLEYRQEILLDIMKAYDEMGLSFAFPTQTVHLATEGRLGIEAGLRFDDVESWGTLLSKGDGDSDISRILGEETMERTTASD